MLHISFGSISELVMDKVEKDVWSIVVNKTVIQKVVFDEPVTADEALDLYADYAYADILDEDEIFADAVEVKGAN